jgi:adenylate cyclase
MNGAITVIYENEGSFLAEEGSTILDTSLKNEIPHMHVCGGNARCSTCRVLVLDGMNHLDPPTDEEKKLARMKNFEGGIRLACQARIRGDVRIRRLVMDDTDADIAVSTSGPCGRERRLAVLFSDIRNFTPFAERQLPYDIIHILNRYFKAMGASILENGGHIDKYIGDGIMAVFGLNDEPDTEKCWNAARAALEMIRMLRDVNEYVEKHFGEKFQIGIGLHFSRVVVGEVGHPEFRQFTAIGDGVNTASRIENMTKKAGASILASEEFVKTAGDTIQIGRVFLARLKGKSDLIKLYEIASCEKQKDETLMIRHHLKSRMPLTIAPGMLRLAFHEAMTRGQISRALQDDEEINQLLSQKEHDGLAPAISFINEVLDSMARHEVPTVAPSDLIYLAGAVAVELTGGPYIPVKVPIEKESPSATKLPGIPDEMEPFHTLLIRFRRAGLDRKEMVALTGAHTLGRAHGRQFTENPYRFDNEYFKRLLRDDMSLSLAMLASDRELLKDEKTRQLVELYAGNEEFFFNDFRNAYLKMIRMS